MQKYRRSIFLINRPFQLKFAFFVCSWLFALSLAYPLVIYNLFDLFFRYLSRDPNGPGLAALQTFRQEIIFLLATFQIFFLIITFMISIFVSHRIAGPLYKLKNFFKQNGGGKLSPDLHFRKNDHFQDVAHEYNLMLSKLRAELRGVHETVVMAANELDGLSASGNLNADQLKKLVQDLHQAGERIPH
jgi:methyl-accepting chemotaxis protein